MAGAYPLCPLTDGLLFSTTESSELVKDAWTSSSPARADCALVAASQHTHKSVDNLAAKGSLLGLDLQQRQAPRWVDQKPINLAAACNVPSRS